jgi:flagellar biosynthesis protein FlhF
MDLRTYRAPTLQQAIQLVRDDLGPDAAVLYTREVGSPWLRYWGFCQIEVTASAEAEVPSRLPPEVQHWVVRGGRARAGI